MSVILALSLFAAPSRAGVVAPVEVGVAPAGPASPGSFILPAAGASFVGTPFLGASFDWRGGLPLLPAPVPGLIAPGALTFVAPVPAAALLKATLHGRRARARAPTEATQVVGPPSLPAPHEAVFAAPRERFGETLERSFADVRLEEAADLGRRLFDRSLEAGRGRLREEMPLDQSRFLPKSVGKAASEGEILRDAVAAAPGGAPPVGAFGVALGAAADAAPRPLFLDLPGSGLIVRVRSALGAALAPAAAASQRHSVSRVLTTRGGATSDRATRRGNVTEPYGEEMPLDQSRFLPNSLESGPLPESVGQAVSPHGSVTFLRDNARLAAVWPSTVWLERGGLLEAVSVADAYAGRGFAKFEEPASFAAVTDYYPPVPSSQPSSAASWWVWAVVPLLVVVIRVL